MLGKENGGGHTSLLNQDYGSMVFTFPCVEELGELDEELWEIDQQMRPVLRSQWRNSHLIIT